MSHLQKAITDSADEPVDAGAGARVVSVMKNVSEVAQPK
jgi:hypothetical protein